jgi:hypothetical protein
MRAVLLSPTPYLVAGYSRCDSHDMKTIGNDQHLIAEIGRCIPPIVTESGVDGIEECIKQSFSPDDISDSCKQCAKNILKDDGVQFDIKLCAFKCFQAKDDMTCHRCRGYLVSHFSKSCDESQSLIGKPRQDSGGDDSGIYQLSSFMSSVLACVVIL